MKMQWYLFFFISTISAITLNANLLPSKIQCRILPNLNRIFKKFNYPVMLHIDNSTAINWKIVKLNEHKVMTVINYDNKFWDKMPQKVKYIQLINTRFLKEDFNRLRPKLSVEDVIVLFQTDKKIGNNILNKFIRFRLMIVIDTKTCKIYICFYGEKSTCHLKMFGLNDPIPPFVKRKSLDKLTIGYSSYPPFVYRDENKQFKGIEIRIVDVLSRKFNFTYDLMSFDQIESNRSHVEAMISKVISKEISWGIGAVSLTSERLKYFHSVTYTYMEGYSVIFDNNFDSTSLNNYITTFVEFKLISLFSACLITLIVFAYCRMKNEKFERYVNLIFFPVYEQPQSIKIVRGNFLRIFFLLWWLSCSVLTISFKVFLFSTNLRGSQTVPTLLHLVKNGFEFKSGALDYVYIKSQCRRKINACQLLMPRFSPFEEGEMCQIFQEMFRKKLAIIGEVTATRFSVYSRCNATDEPENHRLLVSMNSLFGTQMHFWPTQESFILTEGFSKTIRVLAESGILLFWQNAELSNKITRTRQEKNNVKFKAMAMNKLILPLVLLFMGLTAAFFVFLRELKRRKSPEN